MFFEAFLRHSQRFLKYLWGVLRHLFGKCFWDNFCNVNAQKKRRLEFKRYLLWYKWVSGIILTKHRTRGFWDLCHNVHKTSSRRFKDVFCSMWMDEALPNIGQESFEISFITSKRHLRDVFKDIFCGISGWTRPYQTQSKNPLKSLS